MRDRRFREGTGASVVVAIGSTAVFTLLSGVLALLLWIAFCIYAIVEIVGDGRPSAIALLLIVVLLVTTLAVLTAVGVWLIGRSLLPARRDRRL